MSHRATFHAVTVTLLLALAPRAFAEEPPPAPAAPAPAVAPAAPPDAEVRRWERARFSTGRLIGEIVAGAIVGSIVAYATFEATCGEDSDCFGAAFLSFGANFAVTPIAVWGTGRLFGGQGSLGWTYLGASTALAPFSVTGPVDETPADALARVKLSLVLSTVFLPITSALLYELSSGMRAARWRETSFAVTPVAGKGGIDGVMGAFSTRF